MIIQPLRLTGSHITTGSLTPNAGPTRTKIVAIILAVIVLVNIFIAVFFSVPDLNSNTQNNPLAISDETISIDE